MANAPKVSTDSDEGQAVEVTDDANNCSVTEHVTVVASDPSNQERACDEEES